MTEPVESAQDSTHVNTLSNSEGQMNINKLLSERRDRDQEIAERIQATACSVYQDMPTDADEAANNHRAHQLMAAAREVGLLQVELAKAAGQHSVIAQMLRDLPLSEVG